MRGKVSNHLVGDGFLGYNGKNRKNNFMKKTKKKKSEKNLPLGKRMHMSFDLAPDFFVKLMLVAGVIFVWRGLWNLMDIYFFPNSFMLSNIAGISIGMLLIYLPDEDFDELV